MDNSKCRVCGSELLPATSFCRQCGAQAGVAVADSEQPTARFAQTESGITQRFDPRPTSPDRAGLIAPEAQSIATSAQTKRRLFVIAVIVAVVAGLWWYVAVRERSTKVLTATIPISKAALMYPGAQSIVDMANTDGSRTIQLETPDSLDKVERWYQTNLPFTKTVRLTSASVVMKNDNLTITLANEDNKTVILIKQLR